MLKELLEVMRLAPSYGQSEAVKGMKIKQKEGSMCFEAAQ